MTAHDWNGHVPAEPGPARPEPDRSESDRSESARPHRGWGHVPRWLKVVILADLAVIVGASAVGIIQAIH